MRASTAFRGVLRPLWPLVRLALMAGLFGLEMGARGLAACLRGYARVATALRRSQVRR
jgi:hypothetical protein